MLTVDKKRELIKLIENYGNSKQKVGFTGATGHPEYEETLIKLQEIYNKIIDFLDDLTVLDEDQADQQQETKKRKVLQLTTIAHPMGYTGFAVTDDGLIFKCELGRQHSEIKWEKLPEIPQD